MRKFQSTKVCFNEQLRPVEFDGVKAVKTALTFQRTQLFPLSGYVSGTLNFKCSLKPSTHIISHLSSGFLP